MSKKSDEKYCGTGKIGSRLALLVRNRVFPVRRLRVMSGEVMK